MGRPGQALEGQHDQGVTGEHGQALAVSAVHRGLAAPGGGIVEAGQVIVDQRGAMQELYGDGCRGGQAGIIKATGLGYRQAQLRPDTGASGEHCMPNCASQFRRAAPNLASCYCAVKGCLNVGNDVHGRSPSKGRPVPV